MNPILRIAAIQTEIHWENKDYNLKRVNDIVSGLQNIDLAILPEMFATGFTMKSFEFAESEEGPSESCLYELAKKKKIILGGTWIRKNGSLPPLNTFSLFDENGLILRYDKIHPFSYAGEDKSYSSGQEVFTFERKGFKICPLICYDLRFPETFRKVVGADLFLVSANWPSSRVFAWLSLLKARAIENQAYVLGVNRVGVAGKREKLFHNGYSAFFGPKGEETILSSEKEDVLIAYPSIVELKKFRETFPYLKDIKG